MNPQVKENIISDYFNRFLDPDFIRDSSTHAKSDIADPIFKNIVELNYQQKISSKQAIATVKPSKNTKIIELMDKLAKDKARKDKEKTEIEAKLKNIDQLLYEERVNEFHNLLRNDKKLEKIYFERSGRQAEVEFERKVIDDYAKIMTDDNQFTVKKMEKYQMKYKLREDKLLLLRFESEEIERNTLDFLTLLNDTEKFPLWYPMCDEAKVAKQDWKSRKICKILANIPVISNRDFVVYGFGSNDLASDRTISVFVRSIDGTNIGTKFQEKRKGVVRGIIHNLCFKIHVIDENKFRFEGMLCSDPKVNFLPASLLAFVTRKLINEMFTMIFDILKSYKGSKYETKSKNKWLQEFVDFIEEQKEKYIN